MTVPLFNSTCDFTAMCKQLDSVFSHEFKRVPAGSSLTFWYWLLNCALRLSLFGFLLSTAGANVVHSGGGVGNSGGVGPTGGNGGGGSGAKKGKGD